MRNINQYINFILFLISALSYITSDYYKAKKMPHWLVKQMISLQTTEIN